MKKIFNFGEIDFTGNGKADNLVTIEAELKTRGGKQTYKVDPKTKERTHTGNITPSYVEFTASGSVWNARQTDCLTCGQCLDTIAEYIADPVFAEIYKLWKQYHLNGMHAGTPEQEAAVNEWKAAGNKYDYMAACEYLKSINMYEVNCTVLSGGRRYNNEPYRYGSAWLIQELPGDVLIRLEHLLSTPEVTA